MRQHLLLAAENKTARGGALQARLYIPEVFSVEQRDVIHARRIVQWVHAIATPGKPQDLLLLIAEVKAIVPTRYGHKAVIKHVPDQAFALDGTLYRRLGRRFEGALALWGCADNLHMVMIATFGVSEAGVPAIEELSLMPVSGHWLPVEDAFELHLIDGLVRDGRSFVKGLRYNLSPEHILASAILTDAGDTPAALFIARHDVEDRRVAPAILDLDSTRASPVWICNPALNVIPALPSKIA